MLALLALLVLTLCASADIGPRPECDNGTHSEYLYGNHCVKDGYHLERKEGGGIEEVADAPTPPATPEAPAPLNAAPEPPATEPPAPPIAEAAPAAPAPAPAPETKCATAPGGASLGLLVVFGALLLRRRRGAPLGVLAALAGCGNECGYFEQCDGDSTLLECGSGVDQMFGRKVRSVPCDEDNPVCVAEGDSHAACVAATSCDASIPSACDGDNLVQCGEVYTALGGTLAGPYETVVNCVTSYGEGATCVTTETGATCQVESDSGGA